MLEHFITVLTTTHRSSPLHNTQFSRLRIKDLSREDRPREKLLLKGLVSLTNAELIGIIIGSGNDELTAMDLARNILNHYQNDLNRLSRCSVKDLQSFRGIGEAKAISIISALELGKRKVATKHHFAKSLNDSKSIFDLISPELVDKVVEEFWVVMLNNANKLIKKQIISTGGMCNTIADSRVIFKIALENNATKIVLVHNHPSGEAQPSKQDIDITKKLKAAGDSLDIAVTDHLIVSGATYYSFLDSGLL